MASNGDGQKLERKSTSFPKRTKKVIFKPKQRKFEDEATEVKRLKSSYDKIDSSKIMHFKDFPLSRRTLEGLKTNSFSSPTEIQKESIGLALRGLDILGAAKTGSGKTLAFIIPVLERLYTSLWTSVDGLGALIISPTRELAYQIFETLRYIGVKHDFSAGLIIGGKDLKFERRRMDQVNIIICTPGRLLQHMDENPVFDCSNLQILVLDEADRCLDMGFEQTMNAIIANLPPDRQTLLFSATQTKSVKDLGRLSLKSPVYVSVHENSKFSTPESLQQSYIVCPLESKLDMLWSFMKHHKRSKILVFLSSCKQVRFAHLLFCRMRPGISLLALYGSLHQLKRMSVYEEFCKKQEVVLIATDIAARGLDFPDVDWVVQMDCPEDATTYIHRVGRTARYKNGGEALLVLLPSEEMGMMDQLNKSKIPVNKIDVNQKKMMSVRRKFESLLARDINLKECGQRSFKAYLKSVYLMKNKNVFDVTSLDLPSFARSLGLAVAPRVRFLQKRLNDHSGKAKSGIANSESDDRSDSNEGSDCKEVVEELNLKSESAVTFDFSVQGEDSEDCEDLFMAKKPADLSQYDESNELAELNELNLENPKPKKAKTRAQIAKKLLKKKIQSNKIVLFDEEGEAVPNIRRERQSEIAKIYEREDVAGINIEQAKQILKLEDHYDKKIFRDRIRARHREERIRAKLARKGLIKEDVEAVDDSIVKIGNAEGESDNDGHSSDCEPDLNWLPDPDKVYSRNDDDSGDDTDTFIPIKPKAGKKKTKRKTATDNKSNNVNVGKSGKEVADEELQSTIPTKKPKRRKLDSKRKSVINDNDEIDGSLMEDLALQLLSKS